MVMMMIMIVLFCATSNIWYELNCVRHRLADSTPASSGEQNVHEHQQHIIASHFHPVVVLHDIIGRVDHGGAGGRDLAWS